MFEQAILLGHYITDKRFVWGLRTFNMNDSLQIELLLRAMTSGNDLVVKRKSFPFEGDEMSDEEVVDVILIIRTDDGIMSVI